MNLMQALYLLAGNLVLDKRMKTQGDLYAMLNHTYHWCSNYTIFSAYS